MTWISYHVVAATVTTGYNWVSTVVSVTQLDIFKKTLEQSVVTKTDFSFDETSRHLQHLFLPESNQVFFVLKPKQTITTALSQDEIKKKNVIMGTDG